MLLALLVLAGMVVCAAVVVRRGDRAAAGALLVLAVVWVKASGPLEGAHLVHLADGVGITASDALSVPAAVLALVALRRTQRTATR